MENEEIITIAVVS